jgi:hypothetical protein
MSRNQVRVAFDPCLYGSPVPLFPSAGHPSGSRRDAETGCVARSHRRLGSLIGPHDSDS